MPICRFQRFSVREAREVAATFVPVSVADGWLFVVVFLHARKLMEKGSQHFVKCTYIYIYDMYYILYMYIIIFLIHVLYMYIQFECNEMLKKTSICAWKC